MDRSRRPFPLPARLRARRRGVLRGARRRRALLSLDARLTARLTTEGAGRASRGRHGACAVVRRRRLRAVRLHAVLRRHRADVVVLAAGDETAAPRTAALGPQHLARAIVADGLALRVAPRELVVIGIDAVLVAHQAALRVSKR